MLHRDPFPAEPHVLVGRGKDQVAELAEARIGPVGGRLAPVEVDRPATERDGRRRAALGPDDAGRSRRRAHSRQPALDDDDPADPGGRCEDRRPATDRAGPDDDQIRALDHHG